MSLGNALCSERALRRQFPHVDAEVIETFAASVEEGEALDADMAMALADMQREALEAASGEQAIRLPTRDCTVDASHRQNEDCDDGLPLDIAFDGGSGAPNVGTVLRIYGVEAASKIAMAVPTGEVLALQSQTSPMCFHATQFGMHELRLQTPEGPVRRCRFMVSSQLGDFAEAFDHFYDACDWAWDGEWTEDFEDASVNLLVALDEHFEKLLEQLKSGFMGDSLKSSIEGPKKRLEKHLATLMDTHDILACGRAEACLRSFLLAQSLLDMFCPMMGMSGGAGGLQGSEFYQAVLNFERARLAAASVAKQTEVKNHIRRLIDTADAHYSELHGSKSQGLIERWHGGLRESMEKMIGTGLEAPLVDPLPFQQLRGGGGGYMQDMMANMMGSFGGSQGAALERSETTEGMTSLAPAATYEEAEAKVTRWAESLVNESVGFGSPTSPFELHSGEPYVRTVHAALQSVLSLGFGYVAQGSEEKEGEEKEEKVAKERKATSMTILMDRVRASLPLNGEAEFLLDRRRRDRLKDVLRVVRAAGRKGQRLSLSVNTDFAGALKALKEHHEDSWIDPTLEAVWKTMAPENKAFVFELWLHDVPAAGQSEPPAPRLVAADFGHPHTGGKAYYVTTRFFDRRERNLQPGFILAFAEAMCLKQAGLELWDLGGADASPMMHYKPQVAIEMGRSEFIRRLRELSEPHADVSAERKKKPLTDPEAAPPFGGEGIPTGVVFADITESNIWGFVALRTMEEKAKVAAAIADKAAKKAKSVKGNIDKAAKVPRTMEEKAKVAAAIADKAAKKAKSVKGVVASEPSKDPSPQQQKLDTDTVQSSPSSNPKEETDAKAELKKQFTLVFQQLLAEGLSQTEAAARALKVVAP